MHVLLITAHISQTNISVCPPLFSLLLLKTVAVIVHTVLAKIVGKSISTFYVLVEVLLGLAQCVLLHISSIEQRKCFSKYFKDEIS